MRSWTGCLCAPVHYVGDNMDSKKILAICVVIVVVAASAGIAFAVLNKGDNPTIKVSYLQEPT